MSSIVYDSFDQIPSATELKRMWRLQDAALRKSADTPALVSDEDIHVITIMGSEDEGRKARRMRGAALLEAERRNTKTAIPAAREWDKRAGEDEPAWRKRIGRFPAKVWMVFEAVEAVWKFIEEMNTKNAERNEKIGALESRLAALELRPELSYQGTYDSTKRYEAGHAVTCSGSVWIAKRATMLRPDEQGDGARDWTLACKRGANGRDGKDVVR